MKVTRSVAVLVALVGFCYMSVAAQDKAASKPKPAAKPAAEAAGTAMPMPKAAPEMTKLIKMMSGNWTVSEKYEPSPMMPKGGSGTGTAKISQGPGGLSLMVTYHSSGSMGPNFSGVGTWWYDSKAQVFHGLWCDNGTPNGCDAGGTSKWEGDKFVGTEESEEGGQKMAMRFVYSDFKPDSFVMTWEMGPDATKLQKSMTITYTKAAGKM